jgi:hypothetical protein
MLVSEKRRFLFVHIQKTGGATVSELLNQTVSDTRALRPRHMRLREAIERERIPEACFQFAFVRNPWDRLVSWYTTVDRARRKRLSWNEDSVQRGRFQQNPLYRSVLLHAPTFEDFVKNCTQTHMVQGVPYSFALDQLSYVTDEGGKMLADFVGRFERFEEDLTHVFDRLGLTVPDIPHKNRGPRRGHYSEFYTPESEEIVRQRFKRDIEAFGYVFAAKLSRSRES